MGAIYKIRAIGGFKELMYFGWNSDTCIKDAKTRIKTAVAFETSYRSSHLIGPDHRALDHWKANFHVPALQGEHRR